MVTPSFRPALLGTTVRKLYVFAGTRKVKLLPVCRGEERESQCNSVGPTLIQHLLPIVVGAGIRSTVHESLDHLQVSVRTKVGLDDDSILELLLEGKECE